MKHCLAVLLSSYDQSLFIQATVQTNNLNKQFFHNKFTIHTSDPEAKNGYEKVNKVGSKTDEVEVQQCRRSRCLSFLLS